ncbi:MAG: bifunctional glutamate N-acetyltransferase/amino-acid acetyltransferase ArgJ [Ardenticatenales bacterium]|nr:bifunctional glutamate N-acetyltransferase/amino-acid acetyltransferase ArgJ [Ardenticatenales bacterium]
MDEITIASVKGFRAAGVHAGLKKADVLDMALVVSDRPCVAAGTFTQNLVRAAPVLYDQAALAENRTGIRAVVINAKNANAVTGAQGMRDALEMATLTEQALDLPHGSTLVMSTGVIGVPLPMAKIAQGIQLAAQALGDSVADGQRASEAIMTTDTHPKRAARQIVLDSVTVTLAGMAKGAGMIHPNMATMLGLIVTDGAIDAEPLQSALYHAVERSYNCITVDGDTSTNDTQLVLANGAAGNPMIDSVDHPAYPAFCEALHDLCVDLARQIAFDGEGATKHVTIQVHGLPTFEEARAIGRTIATSPLVKTALYGRDANWGRVLAAAGRADVPFDPARASLWFGDLQLLREGTPLPVDEARALEILSAQEIYLTFHLDHGEASALVWTCDFSVDYVNVNAEYRT